MPSSWSGGRRKRRGLSKQGCWRPRCARANTVESENESDKSCMSICLTRPRLDLLPSPRLAPLRVAQEIIDNFIRHETRTERRTIPRVVPQAHGYLTPTDATAARSRVKIGNSALYGGRSLCHTGIGDTTRLRNELEVVIVGCRGLPSRGGRPGQGNVAPAAYVHYQVINPSNISEHSSVASQTTTPTTTTTVTSTTTTTTTT